MLRSMYSGVAGLRVHQTKMDVVGNNIANVNTTGYKSSRVTFKEMLTQTIRGASQPTSTRGGLNPIQIGMGVGLGSIDTDFSPGNFQPTGKPTDIAIKGNGFFVVNDGGKNYFTRAGAFTFDDDGNLVHSTTGYKVQGWMADKQGVMNTGPNNMTSLSLGELNMTPKPSTYITYTGNMDSDKDIADLKYSPDKISITDLTGKSAELYVTLNKTNGANTADRSDDRWTWEAYTDIPVQDEAIAANHGVAVPLAAAAGPGFNKINAGTVVVTDNAGTTTYSEGTDYTVDYVTGEITALATGAILNGQNLLVDYVHHDQITTGDVTLDETGAINAATTLNFNITLRDTAGNTALCTVNAPQIGQTNGGFFEVATTGVNASTIDGEYGPVVATSYTVYDSKGNNHTINLSFVKTDVNRWDWYAEGPVDPSGNPYNLVGNNGTILFDTHGNISGTPSGGPIVFQPFDADPVVITPDFSAITQFASADTAEASNADGFEAGSLNSYDIDATGTIIGYYSNGLYQPIAKLAIATFSNAEGLNRSGDTIFTESNNSGTPSYGLPGIGGKGLINPGGLEMSNVDLADQFTEMITTQRGFQASSKIIATADQILQDLVNLKR